MAVKIRLTRKGDAHAPFYRVVVADSRAPRDGKFIDIIGTYNPLTNPAEIKIDAIFLSMLFITAIIFILLCLI